MTRRGAEIDRFLTRSGWPDAAHETLAEDASFRRYERVSHGGATAVLMDAPPVKEDVRPFVRIARTLSALGLSAPRILAEDAEAGFLLLEDLGDATFTRLLDQGVAARDLYALATDVLIELHRHPAERAVPAGLASYDDELLLNEAALMVDWYLPAVTGAPTSATVTESYIDLWRDLLAAVRAVPQSLVLRDYHVDNLIRLDGREGVAACGLLDFQDAVAGPVSYDFVSLVEDARRDVPAALAAEMRARYLAAFPSVDPGAFDVSCAVLGAQRHCKVLGIFTRLRDRDGKDNYLHHVPRLWRLLERSVENAALAPLKEWLEEYVPPARRIVPPAGGAA